MSENERQDPAEAKKVDVAVETQSQAPDATADESKAPEPVETTVETKVTES